MNKYNARKTYVNGRRFDSATEAARAEELYALEEAGEIEELEDHPRLELERGIFYRPDFFYIEKGRFVWEDVKGIETERFRLICKIWRNHGEGILRITKRGKREGFVVVKEIPGRP